MTDEIYTTTVQIIKASALLKYREKYATRHRMYQPLLTQSRAVNVRHCAACFT